MNKYLVRKNKKSGFTLVEMLFALFVVAVLSIALGAFERSIFSQSSYLQGSFRAENDARNILRQMISEFRSMNYSGVGGYPIEEATLNSITFYSDINNDGKTERIRYFKESSLIKKGIIYPTGSPISYSSSEVVSTIVRDISSSPSVFTYYDSSYDGSGQSLSEPINIISIRLIAIDIPLILKNGTATSIYEIKSQVSIRNLKENL